MRLSTWACAWAVTGCLFMGDAMAQQLRQPFSVQPVGFDYNRYLQEDSSPSDVPPPVKISEDAEGDVASEAGSAGDDGAESAVPMAASSGGGCDTCCSNSCCCDSCDWCNLGDAFSLSDQLFCKDSPWSLGGWTQVGYNNKPTGIFPLIPLFNDLPGKFYLHQQWAWLEKEANGECYWDWGFRADIMYGIDGTDTQAFGNDPGNWDYLNGWDHGIYSFALPQLYGVLERGDLNIKFGHFYTLVGYEVVQAPDNFFFSHSYTFYNSEPFTHTGALASYAVSDNLEVYGGWTLGWDTGFDQFNDGNNFLGGFKASLTDDVSLTYITTIGDFGARGDQGYMQSVVLDANLTDKLNYVFQSDLLQIDSVGEDNVGINQYLFYTVNDCVAVGGRLEWWKYDPLVAGQSNVSVYEATFGVNLRPHANLIFRPEIRQDWAPGFGYDQTIFGIDAIATY